MDEPYVKVPTFEIEVILSDQAEELLKRDNESVLVSILFLVSHWIRIWTNLVGINIENFILNGQKLN